MAATRIGALLIAWVTCGVAAAATTSVAPADLQAPKCELEQLLVPDATATKCGLRKGIDLSTYTPCPKVAGFGVVNGKCAFVEADAKPPTCDKSVPNLAFDAASKTCKLVVGQPTSGAGDYVGDCFKVKAPEGKSPPAHLGLSKGTYAVTHQENIDEDDRMLTLVGGNVFAWPVPFLFGCRSEGGPEYKVPASSLIRSGADRVGWAYGVLTMPYKYYRKSKNFTNGLPPLGGYVGWRTGQVGTGVTLAGAFTLSSVKADTVDPTTLDANGAPTVTGSTDVPALSAAVGIVFDISKRPRTKPFKVGFFVGQDRISRSDTVSYQNDGRGWIALQIGYDFTDN